MLFLIVAAFVLTNKVYSPQYVLWLLPLALALLVAGCASHKDHATPAVGTLNTRCPVSGEALEASSPTADYMGGKVGFDSVEGQGATFFFDLPVVDPAPDQ